MARKTILKYVGDFVELGYDHHPNAPSLAAGRGKRKPENKQKVVAYLRAGVAFIVSPGIAEDWFDRAKRAGIAHIRTDGVYVWSTTLAYYVEKYDVELPVDFEKHMARNKWAVPMNVDKLAIELPRYE